MKSIILVTGASTGIGTLSARSLAHDGHTVYASMRDLAVRELRAFADAHNVSLHPLELDVRSQASADFALETIYQEQGRLDVVMHNAGHLVVGPAEAFTPDEIMRSFDVNVLGAQRVNRAALPPSAPSSPACCCGSAARSTRGGHPPFLGPYAAAKAAMDSLAVDYAYDVARFGIETAIVVPGALTKGTSHFPKAGKPADTETVAANDARCQGIVDAIGARLSALTPDHADPQAVADEVTRGVNLPAGQRPFRSVIDFLGDGFKEVSVVADQVRIDFAHRIGIADLLTPTLTQVR